MLPFSSFKCASLEAQSPGMESVSLRKRHGSMRQENTCLTVKNALIGNVDPLEFELPTSKSQFLRMQRLGIDSEAEVLSEQVHQLENKLDVQAHQLKAAELRAECCQKAAAHNNIVLANLTEELNAVREELDETTAFGKRTEQQRNQALENAEELKDAFKNFKANVSLKLLKGAEMEQKLKQSLVECGRNKEQLQMKFTALEREKADQNHKINQLNDELKKAKAAAADFHAEIEEATRKASHVEHQLATQGVECREKISSLRRELDDLRALNHSQEQQVAQSHRETEQCQMELSSLEAILALLHLQENTFGKLCAGPCMLPPVDYTGSAYLLKLKPGEGYQQLLRVIQSAEGERQKQSSLIEQLQERLSRAQEEISSLKNSMTQRDLHFQNLHTELMEKVSKAADTEKELKRKSSRVAALEKQLQEKSSAYGQAALKNTELENQLKEKTSAVQNFQSMLRKKQKEYQQVLEKSHQYSTQQHRIELLQVTVDKTHSRLLEMEPELNLLQRERDEAQKSALELQTSLDQLVQEKEIEVRLKEDMLHSLKELEARSAAEVSELQASLYACREELNLCLQQMEEMKKSYEEELQKCNNQISSLQEKLCSSHLVCERSSEQNLQLQLCLQRHQTMLTESTARVSELEESQSQLQQQVSNVELQLERSRISLENEVRNRELDAEVNEKTVQEMKQEKAEISHTISHLTTEMKRYRGELVSKESDVEHLRVDLNKKNSQITHLEESLHLLRNQLASKNETVLDLEEKLLRCDADRLSCTQQVRTLEGQLQTVRTELADTLEALKELRDVLQRTQTISDERQTSVEKLTVQLSETKRELEERTHEVLDIDNALKERQGELQQRAILLGQLDVAIKERKQELERKVESLQRSLEERESELRATRNELRDRNIKESQKLTQAHQLSECRHKKLLDELEEAQSHCQALSGDLEMAKLQTKETEAQLRGVEEALSLKEAQWLQLEAELQFLVKTLELELEKEKEQHSKELDSVQQTRGQLLRVSEQISSTMRSSQEQLTVQLQQSQSQLEQAKAQVEQSKVQLEQAKTELDVSKSQVSHLQTRLHQSQEELLQTERQLQQSRLLYEQSRVQNAHLHTQIQQLSVQVNQYKDQAAQLHTQLLASEKSVESSNDSLLIKVAEVSRLQARISSLERVAERQNLYNHSSLPILHQTTEHPASTTPQKLQATISSPSHPHPSLVPSTTHTHLSPPGLSHPEAAPALQQLACPPLCDSSLDSSLDLPLSLKGAVRDALGSSLFDPFASPLPDSTDQSWQGLSATDATMTSDISFNPLTYMMDKESDVEVRLMEEGENKLVSESKRESVSTLVAEEDDKDLSSLTGMLRFVNHTLAMQEDPSSWISTEVPGT